MRLYLPAGRQGSTGYSTAGKAENAEVEDEIKVLINAPVVQLDTRLPARQGIPDFIDDLLCVCN